MKTLKCSCVKSEPSDGLSPVAADYTLSIENNNGTAKITGTARSLEATEEREEGRE